MVLTSYVVVFCLIMYYIYLHTHSDGARIHVKKPHSSTVPIIIQTFKKGVGHVAADFIDTGAGMTERERKYCSQTYFFLKHWGAAQTDLG